MRCALRSMVGRLGWLFTLGVMLPGALYAETAGAVTPRNVQFTHVTTEDGLTQRIVHSVVQDRRGYMWFATQEGLNRYDGHVIDVYQFDSTDPDSLSHDFSWTLFVDAAGELWIGTDGGINRYDELSDSFVREPFADIGITGLGDYRVRTLTQDSAGRYWLGTVGDGLVRIDPGARTLAHFRHDPELPGSLPDDTVLAILEDRSGQLWVGTDGGGLARLQADTDSFEIFRHSSGKDSLSDDRVRAIYEDREGRLWIGTREGGLNVMDRERGTFRRFGHDPDNPASLGHDWVRSILQDRDGTLWIATDGGLSEWRPDVDGFVTYRHDPSNRRSLGPSRLNELYQDRSGVLWITGYGGVSKWNYFSDAFTYYRAADGFLAGDVVTSIAEAGDGVLWLGTYGSGLTRLDPGTGQSTHYRADPKNPGSLSDDRVMVVHVDREGTVWAGTRAGGLNRLNLDTGRFDRFVHVEDDPASLSGNGVTSLYSDLDGTLWVGVFEGGLNRLSNAADGSFEHFRHDPGDPSSLSTDRVLAIARDRDGALWISGEGGILNRLDDHGRGFQRYALTGQAAGDPTGVIAWDIVESADGSLWIGTLGAGLVRWERSDRSAGRARFQYFSKSNGLRSNTINGIVEGPGETLWFSSNIGLTLLDYADGSVRHFDSDNGLGEAEFNQGARARTHAGRVLFGGTQGLLGFDPGGLRFNDHSPNIVITARSRQEHLVTTGTGDPVPGIELGYLDPFIAFEFVGLDFTSPDKNRHRYRLVGFDDEWIEADRYRRAIYTNLPAGRYNFQVEASNNDNVWNLRGTSIDLTVIPPPWFSWWAYVLYVAFGVCAVLLYLRSQRIKLRFEADQRVLLEEEVHVRTRELAERNEELTEANTKLAEASITDSLTGLRNRRYVDQFIAAEIALVERRMLEGGRLKGKSDQRDSARMMFFMMIDLDGFKRINDDFGHHAGDMALVEVKNRLLGCCRQSDSVVRWGGDEFMVIGHATAFQGAKVLAERIRERIAENAYEVGQGRRGKLSASIGLAPYPFAPNRVNFVSWEQIAGVADQAAYIAKANGRNMWVSIAGTETTSPEDFPAIATDMVMLLSEGKLLIDTSTEATLALPGSVRSMPRPARR